MTTKSHRRRTKPLPRIITRPFFVLAVLFVLCDFSPLRGQSQKIKVDVNVACADSDSGVNDAQVYFNGILVDLSNPPRGSDRIDLTPGTYLIKASLKSLPGAVIKDIYSSGPDDTYPGKYEPTSLGDGISLALDRQARPGSAIAYSMRIDMTRCVPGSPGPPVPGGRAGPVKKPTPTDVSVFVLVTWMCKGDVGEQQLFPMGGATVLIENETYPIQDDGTALGIEPSGERRVTAFVPAGTGGQKDERYRLAYVLKGPRDAGARYYPDATGFARVPLTGKEGEFRPPVYLTFRLVRDCPGNVALSNEQLEIAKYVVLKMKGPFSWQSITHLGNRQDAQVGMQVVNGDIIETSSDGAMLLYIPDKLNRFEYYLMVHPNTKLKVFFVPVGDNDIEPKFVVDYGTISQKLIRGGDTRIKTNTVSDRTTVGLEDGTIYSWSYNQQRQETTISVEAGALFVKPKNPTLQPVTLRAGQQIQVTPSNVSGIRPSPSVSNIDYGNGISLGKVGNTGGVAGEPTGGSSGSGRPSSGIGGTWTAPTGDTVELIQNGNRITGSYRGTLGSGSISGYFDGKTLSGTVQINQGLIPVAMPLNLTLTSDGRLEGQVGSALFSVSLILTRR
jgi:hypothetical protein